MQLLDPSGNPAVLGKSYTTFRGELCELLAIEPPRHAGSTGRVILRFSGSNQDVERYPSVIGLRWHND